MGIPAAKVPVTETAHGQIQQAGLPGRRVVALTARRIGRLLRNRYDVAKKYNERVGLGTADLEVAKEKVTELHLRTRLVKDERPETASLADILRRYWEEHASKLRSAKSNRHCINVWLDHWQDDTVGDLGVKRQEAFHTWMRARGYRATAMMRVINIGKAALNRALKRGELALCPHILTVAAGKSPPMGRPLDVPELRRIYWHAQPHVQAFILWALGTGARPQAVLELHSDRVRVWSRSS